MTKVNAVDLSVYQAACIKLAELLLNISGCQVRISQGASPTVSLGSSPVAESSVYQSLRHLILASLAVTTIAPKRWWRTWGSTKGKNAPTRSAQWKQGALGLFISCQLKQRLKQQLKQPSTSQPHYCSGNQTFIEGGEKNGQMETVSQHSAPQKKNPLQGISFNVLSQYCKHTHNNEARVQSWSFQDWDLFVKENVERCILPNVNLIIRAQQLFFIAI